MVLPKHGEPGLRRLLSPGKQAAVGPPRGFLPFRFGREPLCACLAEILCLMPCDIKRRPAGQSLVGYGVHRDNVPDEFLEFVRRVFLPLLEDVSVLTET